MYTTDFDGNNKKKIDNGCGNSIIENFKDKTDSNSNSTTYIVVGILVFIGLIGLFWIYRNWANAREQGTAGTFH
jgi:ATP-dependent Zn protease